MSIDANANTYRYAQSHTEGPALLHTLAPRRRHTRLRRVKSWMLIAELRMAMVGR